MEPIRARSIELVNELGEPSLTLDGGREDRDPGRTILVRRDTGMPRPAAARVFIAFSDFVMKALARHPAERGVAAMQAINVAAVTFAFMAALFGTAVVCGALVAWDERFAPHLLGGGLYLVGTILLTIAYHVLRNGALARVEPLGAGAESRWRRYLSGWTAWNHVRAAAAVFTLSLHV